MNQLKCDLQTPELPGLKNQEITVGRILQSTCTGELPMDFNIEKAQFKLTTEEEHTYKILKVEKESNGQLKILWTVYQAGQLKVPELVMTDSAQDVSLDISQLTQGLNVTSVIEKKQEPPKPFGPIFPLNIPWPIWYFIAAAIVIFGGVFWFIYFVYRNVQFQKVKDLLKKYDSPVDADLQFYRSIRVAERKPNPIPDIEHSFYIYLSRRCQLPILDIDKIKAFEFHKKIDPKNKKLRYEMEKIVEEFNHLKSRPANESEILPKLFHFIDEVETQRSRSL